MDAAALVSQQPGVVTRDEGDRVDLMENTIKYVVFNKIELT